MDNMKNEIPTKQRSFKASLKRAGNAFVGFVDAYGESAYRSYRDRHSSMPY